LRSFGINPGGYVGSYDPKIQDMDKFTIRGDRVAERRMKIKKRAKGARRAIRYQHFIKEKTDIRLTKQESGVLKTRKH
jgi:hypothetical protein